VGAGPVGGAGGSRGKEMARVREMLAHRVKPDRALKSANMTRRNPDHSVGVSSFDPPLLFIPRVCDLPPLVLLLIKSEFLALELT